MGVNINAEVDNNGNTLLMMAISRPKLPLTEQIIQAGANLNVLNNRGNTALVLVIITSRGYAISKAPQIIQLLLNNGADITNITNKDGQTALDLALKYPDDWRVMEILQNLVTPEAMFLAQAKKKLGPLTQMTTFHLLSQRTNN